MINFPPLRSVREGPLLQLPTPKAADCPSQPRATPQVNSLTWDLDFPGKGDVPNVQASSTVGGKQCDSRQNIRAGFQEAKRTEEQRATIYQALFCASRALNTCCSLTHRSSHRCGGEALLPHTHRAHLTDEETQVKRCKSFVQGHAAADVGSEHRAHALGHLALLPSPGPAHKPASFSPPSESTSNQVLIVWPECITQSHLQNHSPGSGTGVRVPQ